MKNEHITNILDETAFADLSADDLRAANLHVAECAACRDAFAAARLASLLLKTGAENAPLPSPFFEARVMNALRIKENLRKPLGAFRRWWQASGALVAVMLVTLAAVVALTAIAPSGNEAQATGTNYTLYSTERVILNQRPPREMNAEQVFEVIYASGGDFEKR